MVVPQPSYRLATTLGLSLLLHALVLVPAWQAPGLSVSTSLRALTTLDVTLAAAPVTGLLTRHVSSSTLARPAGPEAVTENSSAAPADPEPEVAARADTDGLHNPKPPYPLAARRRGLEGRVLLEADVNAEGRCTAVRLRQSSGHALLDEAALQTVQRWRFRPASRAGSAVASRATVPIVFRLDDPITTAIR